MAVQLSGLGGFDSSTVISQLVTLAQKPITDLQTKQSLVDSASSTMSTFSSRLGTMKANATALATSSGFSSMTATSSDAAIVASVSGSPTSSTYQISVSQLAKAQKTRSNAVASATTALGQTGDLTLKVGSGDPITISLVATDTLADVATKITKSGAKVSAGIINAGGSYRLSLQGIDTGAANAITFGKTGTVDLGIDAAANQVDAAQDAKLNVDGLDITRSTNQITEAIPGVTLAITKVTTAPATLTLSPDSTALKSKLNAFVASYNDIVNAGHTAAGYGSTKATNTVLAADPAIRRTLDKISSLATGIVAGTSGTYQTLNSVGLSVSRDGIMSFDSDKLDAALKADPAAVRKLFVNDSSTGATGVMKTLADSLDDLMSGTSGAVKTRIDALAAQSKRLVDSQTDKQTRVDAYEQSLRAQFAKLDQAMSKYQSMSTALAGLSST